MLRTFICATSLLAASLCHAADLTSIVNEIRLQGCAGKPGVQAAVQSNPTLEEVARQWSRGGRLSAAIDRIGYQAERSTSIHVKGTSDPAAIRRLLRDEYCPAVNNAEFSEMGVFRRGGQSWMVLAAPFSVADPGDAQAIARRVLELVNEARSQPRRCGRQQHAATHPLELSAQLSEAASVHARDMAAHSSLEHRGTDGSQPAQRVARAGYQWRAVAENIAAGQASAEETVTSWLKSPGHCANIMGKRFTQMGVAFAVEPRSAAGIYWAQVFAAPR